MKNSKLLAIIVWIIGLLGVIGKVNPYGFLFVLIPIIFMFYGSKFTKRHAKEYLNVLLTSLLIYLICFVVNMIFNTIGFERFDITFVGVVYFAIENLMGLIYALGGKVFKAPFTIRLFK